MGVQVLFCTCGDTLREHLNIDELKDFVNGLENVSKVNTTKACCTKDAEPDIVKDITDGGEKVVAFACTRSVCKAPLESIMHKAGLDPDNLVVLNAKEQIAWVHRDKNNATLKAKMLLKAAITRAKSIQPIETRSYERPQEALVIGAGIAGLTAASELTDQGFSVHVIEKKPSIGGAMPLISKTYPEEDCTKCLRGPKMIALMNKPGITYHVSSEIKSVERTEAGFKVTYTRQPISLDVSPRAGIGQPVEVCQSSGDSLGLIYLNRNPSKKDIEKVTSTRCGECASVFPSALMGFDEEPGDKTINVGSVILATGFEEFDPTGIPKWGYGLENVITQYQLARMIDPLGPTGGSILRPTDGEVPEKIVMVQCVGSRDPEYNPWCSKYCCMAAIKHATLIKKFKSPESEVTILFRDIRASGYGFEAMYNDAKDLGIEFVHGDIDNVQPHGDVLEIKYTDGMSEPQSMVADLLILSTGMVPSSGSSELAELFQVETTEGGFMKEVDEKVANITTRAPGVYIAGTCTGPKNIPESIAQAAAAAYMSGNYLGTYIEKEVNHPTVDEEKCGGCGVCRSVCPYEAITIPKDGYPTFDVELCQSCGLCVSSCPTHALETPNFGFDLIDEQVEAILSEKKENPVIIGFSCDDCSYNLLDTAGFIKETYSSSFVPIYVNCMSNLSLRNVLNAAKKGADGIMLIGCVKDRCHFLKGTQRSKGQMQIIGDFFEQAGVKTPIKILESSGTMVWQFLKALQELENKVEEAKR